MTVGESLNVDRLVNWKAPSPWRGSPFRHSGLVQCPRYCWSNSKPAVYMTRRLPITSERTRGAHTSFPVLPWGFLGTNNQCLAQPWELPRSQDNTVFFVFWIPAVNTSKSWKDRATNTEKAKREATSLTSSLCGRTITPTWSNVISFQMVT